MWLYKNVNGKINVYWVNVASANNTVGASVFCFNDFSVNIVTIDF